MKHKQEMFESNELINKVLLFNIHWYGGIRL